MYTRFIAPLCCAAAVAFACGPRPHASANAFPVPASRAEVAHVRADGDEGSIAPTLSVRVGDGVALALHVTNSTGKQTEINFPNGHMYEFRVVDAGGREVWRWGKGRLFTQSLQNRLLSDGETMTFNARWAGSGAHGAFVAVATLLSDNHPMEARAEFTLP
jgi:hypothetical protein